MVENRSEIVLLYDAQDCNPNGNPLDSEDKPRIDRETGKCVVTDVRLKRYLRDQLHQDGHGILIQSPTQYYAERDNSTEVPTREKVIESVTEKMDVDENSPPEEIASQFLDNAADVRYFGATISVDTDELADALPRSITGPLQFQHGRSYNAVSLNTESKKMTSVLASDEGKEQGTFATDNRLKYALIGFNGVVNENVAEFSGLSDTDVERLDHLCWRALKNQTLTRSKFGQEPVLYMRIEYDDGTHIGRLTEHIEIESDKSDTEIRDLTDYVIDITELAHELNDVESVDHVNLVVNDMAEFEFEGDVGSPSEFIDAQVNIINPYEKHIEMNE